MTGSVHRARKEPRRVRICGALLPFTLGLALSAAIPARAEPAADLTSLSLEQLLGVSVVGASKYAQKQGEVAAAVSVITRQEILAFGWRTLAEALDSLPGIYTTYNRQDTSVGARGFGLPGDFNTRLLVMIDGNRVNDPTYDAGRFGWDFPLDMDLIERIEFIPGPGGAVYGQNAMLGVVNVITRSGAALGGAEVAAAYQDPQALRQGRASAGTLLSNGTDLLVSVSGLAARGEDRFYTFGSLPITGVAVGMDGEKTQQILAHAGHGPWSLEEIYGWSKKDDPTASFFSTPLVPGQNREQTTSLTQLQYQNGFRDDTLQLSARLYNGRSATIETLDVGRPYFQTRGTSEWRGGELRLVSAAFAGHKLMAGLEGQDAPVIDQSLHGLGFVDPRANFLIQSPGYRVGVFAQDEWQVVDHLSATLGLRDDRNNITGTRPSPRAALIWQADPATTLKALYGIAHRAPNAYERDYGDGNSQIANPDLQGETIRTIELVADHRIGRDLALRASVYQWTMHDLITQVYNPGSGIPPQYQSGRDVRAKGVELSADKTWDTGARLRGSLSEQNASYEGVSTPLLNSPKHLAKLNLSTPLPVGGLRAGYEWRYDSSRVTRGGTTLGGYALSNLILSTEALAPGLDLSLGIYNALDKRYDEPGALNNWQDSFEQDGRSVRITLRYRF